MWTAEKKRSEQKINAPILKFPYFPALKKVRSIFVAFLSLVFFSVSFWGNQTTQQSKI